MSFVRGSGNSCSQPLFANWPSQIDRVRAKNEFQSRVSMIWDSSIELLQHHRRGTSLVGDHAVMEGFSPVVLEVAGGSGLPVLAEDVV